VARTQAVYYRDSRGTEPVDEFIQALPPKRAAKIDDFVEEYLNAQPPKAPPPAFPITSQIEGDRPLHEQGSPRPASAAQFPVSMTGSWAGSHQ